MSFVLGCMVCFVFFSLFFFSLCFFFVFLYSFFVLFIGFGCFYFLMVDQFPPPPESDPPFFDRSPSLPAIDGVLLMAPYGLSVFKPLPIRARASSEKRF